MRPAEARVLQAASALRASRTAAWKEWHQRRLRVLESRAEPSEKQTEEPEVRQMATEPHSEQTAERWRARVEALHSPGFGREKR